jgi:hypothetical protein
MRGIKRTLLLLAQRGVAHSEFQLPNSAGINALFKQNSTN